MGKSHRQCRDILVGLMEHEYAQPFLQPVDAQGLGLDDYYEKVKVRAIALSGVMKDGLVTG
jgi:hypothetical protein